MNLSDLFMLCRRTKTFIRPSFNHLMLYLIIQLFNQNGCTYKDWVKEASGKTWQNFSEPRLSSNVMLNKFVSIQKVRRNYQKAASSA